eukprot:g56762.t1
MDELCDRLASALKITDVKRLNDIKALLYADDVALIAHSRTELQKMVNVVAKFAEDYRLEVNLKPGKTEIMPIYMSSKAKRPSIRERGEIQARYRLMCWNQLVGAKLKYAFDVWRAPVERILVGSKCDSVGEKVVETARGKALAEQKGIPFFETSAKTNINVVEAFTCIAKNIKKRLMDSNPGGNEASVSLDLANSNTKSCGCN